MMGPSSFQSLNFGHISSIIIFRISISKNQSQAKKFKVGHNYSIGPFEYCWNEKLFKLKNLTFSSSSILALSALSVEVLETYSIILEVFFS